VLIFTFTMFLKERQITWIRQMGLMIFLALFLQSCGIPESNSTVREKNVGAGREATAYKKEAVTLNEPKGVKTERATFALG